MRSVTDVTFELRVGGKGRGKTRTFDTYPTLSKAKRAGLLLFREGIGSGVVRVSRKMVWISPIPEKPAARKKRAPARVNGDAAQPSA